MPPSDDARSHYRATLPLSVPTDHDVLISGYASTCDIDQTRTKFKPWRFEWATELPPLLYRHGAGEIRSALFAKDGVRIDGNGVVTDIKPLYEGNFKGGFDRITIKLKNFTAINNDSAIGDGDAVATIKTDKGEINVAVLCIAAPTSGCGRRHVAKADTGIPRRTRLSTD